MYHRYGALLERRCRLLMRDRAHGEDAVQELLAVLLLRGETFRQADSPWRWLCRAVDRVCLDLLRRGRRVRAALTRDGFEALDPIGAAPAVDIEARYLAIEALSGLDDDDQLLAILLFVDGMTQGEAATELGVSRVTINKRTQRLRGRLGMADEATP